MNPGVPGLETVFATLCAWRHISNLIQVGALLSHDFLLLVFLRSRALDRSPVPPAEVRRGFVCALDKRQQDMVRRLRSSDRIVRSEEHTSELQSRVDLVCRLLLEKKKSRRM